MRGSRIRRQPDNRNWSKGMERTCITCGKEKPMECYTYTVGFGFKEVCKRCVNQRFERDRKAKRAARIRREQS